MHINRKIVLFILCHVALFSSPISAEPESIWEKAKRNAAPDSLNRTTQQTNDSSTAPFVVEKTKHPILLKIIVPWGDHDRPVATIYYRGGQAPYKEGDFVPPFYKLVGIAPNMVSLQCIAKKIEDKKNCITELSFSGVYE